MKPPFSRTIVAGLLGASLLLSACSASGPALPESPSTPASESSTSTPAAASEALDALETLPVKGKAAKTGYERSQFGAAWKDVDKNGCDTRNDILLRDMTNIVFADAKRCEISAGTLDDPYTAKTIQWVKKSNTVDIEHLVALGQAWVSGAQQLSLEERTALANDPINLIAADASANRAKGDREASAWLPPNKSYRCQYVSSQIAVKKKYRLSVTAPEKAAMQQVLSSCPEQGPESGASAEAAALPADTVDLSPAPTPQAETVSPGSYCSTDGAAGISKAGKSYICKTSAADARLRWRS